eukprot:2855154-Prymnesium_polylepis.1
MVTGCVGFVASRSSPAGPELRTAFRDFTRHRLEVLEIRATSEGYFLPRGTLCRAAAAVMPTSLRFAQNHRPLGVASWSTPVPRVQQVVQVNLVEPKSSGPAETVESCLVDRVDGRARRAER